MPNSCDNDNGDAEPARAPAVPDGDGHAAILLIESLIHGLIARSLISVEDAVDIVDTASNVNDELDAETDVPAITAQRARTLLIGIAASLSIDLPDRIGR